MSHHRGSEWHPQRDESFARREEPRGGRDASRRPERDERRHDDARGAAPRHDWDNAARREGSRGAPRGHEPRRADHGAQSRGLESHTSRDEHPRSSEWRSDGRAVSPRRNRRDYREEPRSGNDAVRRPQRGLNAARAVTRAARRLDSPITIGTAPLGGKTPAALRAGTSLAEPSTERPAAGPSRTGHRGTSA